MSGNAAGPVKAAIWARVSTDHQSEDNQVPALEQFCAHHGYEITRRYLLSDLSAFNGAHRETLAGMLDDAYRGEFSVLVVWAVDRISREGIEALLRLIRELRERHVALVSVQETWLNGSDATTELLAAIAAWVAHHESKRRSERIKAGIERRRREGKPIGGATTRKGHGKGSRHSGERKSAAWTPERRAALAERNRQAWAAKKEAQEGGDPA